MTLPENSSMYPSEFWDYPLLAGILTSKNNYSWGFGTRETSFKWCEGEPNLSGTENCTIVSFIYYNFDFNSCQSHLLVSWTHPVKDIMSTSIVVKSAKKR